MHEEFIMMSKMVPEDLLLKQLRSSTDNYLSNPSEENNERLSFHLMMTNLKKCTERESLQETLENIRNVKDHEEFIKLRKDLDV